MPGELTQQNDSNSPSDYSGFFGPFGTKNSSLQKITQNSRKNNWQNLSKPLLKLTNIKNLDGNVEKVVNEFKIDCFPKYPREKNLNNARKILKAKTKGNPT